MLAGPCLCKALVWRIAWNQGCECLTFLNKRGQIILILNCLAQGLDTCLLF
jgi:hypothetical protein